MYTWYILILSTDGYTQSLSYLSRQFSVGACVCVCTTTVLWCITNEDMVRVEFALLIIRGMVLDEFLFCEKNFREAAGTVPDIRRFRTSV